MLFIYIIALMIIVIIILIIIVEDVTKLRAKQNIDKTQLCFTTTTTMYIPGFQ